MRYFVGIDGGQSSTTCLIGDETGRVVGVGRAGPCNHVRTGDGRERFIQAIGGSLQQAISMAALGGSNPGGMTLGEMTLGTAALPPVTFHSACLGLSGGPSDKIELTKIVLRATILSFRNDAETALAGAAAGGPGIVTIAGTGSISWGRNNEGATARAGGWGYVFGDEGGAFEIVRGALRVMLRHEEGWGPASILNGMLLRQSGARTANELMHAFYTDEYPRSKVAALAPLVDEAAQLGDAPAAEILSRAAQSLATITAAVRQQLFPESPANVHYIGGVFRSEFILQRFKLLAEMAEGCRVLPPAYGPAAGALFEAYREAGVACTLKDVPPEKS